LQPEVKTQETAMQVLMNISSDGTQKNALLPSLSSDSFSLLQN